MIPIEPKILYRYLQALVYLLIVLIWVLIIYEVSVIELYTMSFKKTTIRNKNLDDLLTPKPSKSDESSQLLRSFGLEKPYLVKSYESITKLTGDYWILYNYIKGRIAIQPHETITYTTHADYTYLDNLPTLLDRWKGPISIALFAPGEDFLPTIQAIHYLSDCTSNLIKDYVTFHIYFNKDHVPNAVPNPKKLFKQKINCTKQLPTSKPNETYKARKGLTYPVNVGRNIARASAQTHFVLASDIELYPSPNLIPKFLDMIHSHPKFKSTKAKVFVLNIFEVDEKHTIPSTKRELKKMLLNKTAIPFHMYMCMKCHYFPKMKQWIMAKDNKKLGVFHVAKRTGKYQFWEPIFIGTNADPFYDERLTWEGKSDKMTQGYILCVQDYDYMMLDNAFLVHKPGIKRFKMDWTKFKEWNRTKNLMDNVIRDEYKVLYGEKEGCVL